MELRKLQPWRLFVLTAGAWAVVCAMLFAAGKFSTWYDDWQGLLTWLFGGIVLCALATVGLRWALSSAAD